MRRSSLKPDRALCFVPDGASSGDEELYTGSACSSQQLEPVQDADFLDCEIIKTEIAAPLETKEDRVALQSAWVGEDNNNNLESVKAYVKSQNQNNEKIKLAGKQLAGIDLQGSQLPHAEFQWADLSASNFCQSELLQTKFHAATLLNANFTKVTGLDVDFSGTYAIGAIFSGSRLTASSFDLAHMLTAQFVKAELNGVHAVQTDFHSANFESASLVEANLEDANFSHANLKKANLKKANLVNANLVNANLSGTQLAGAKFFPNHTELNEENLRECLNCYEAFYIDPHTKEVNKNLKILRQYMREDLIEKIKNKSSHVAMVEVENLLKIAFEHPVFSVHKNRSSYRINSMFSKNDDENSFRTKSQRALAACGKEIAKRKIPYGY